MYIKEIIQKHSKYKYTYYQNTHTHNFQNTHTLQHLHLHTLTHYKTS